jgi:hypothetical protein
MSMSIVFLVVLSSFVGMFAAIAPASAAAGDLTISGPFTIQNEVYYVDGDVLVTSTGTLTIRDAELLIMNDANNTFSMTIDGGKLILDGGRISTYANLVHPWPLLTLTLQNGATVTMTNDSVLGFPGNIVSSGSTTKVTLRDSNITTGDLINYATYVDPLILASDFWDNGPAISISDSTWELYDSQIYNLPEGLNRADLTLSGVAQFTAINSYISADFDDQALASKNVISLNDHANAYLYGCTFATPPIPYGDSAFSASMVNTNDAGAPANPVPTAKAAWDNATGQLNTALYTENDASVYQVVAQRNMAVTTFNTTGIPSTDVLAVTLVLKYSTGATYAGNRAINYTNGGVTKSLSIVPIANQNTRLEVDMYSLGVDTIAEANALRISFFNSGNVGAGDIQFDALYLEVIVGPQAYIYRMGDITVGDTYGVPLSGATVAAKFNSSTWLGGKNVYYYVPPSAAIVNDPPASILAYMGKTAGNYKTADSKGKVLIPYLTDIISGVSMPNSLFVGSLNVTATSGVSTSSIMSFDAYPGMQPGNVTHSASIWISGALAPSWDTSNFLVVPPSLTIGAGTYTHNGNIICRTGGTLTLNNVQPFMISRNIGETSRIIVGNGGTLNIVDSQLDSNQPVTLEVWGGGTLTIDGSQISSNVAIEILGTATVQITGSSILGSLTVSSGVAATLTIRDTNFTSAPVISGTSVASLANVSAPSLTIQENAKVYLYRWAVVTVKDGTDFPLPGAVVSARWQVNSTLYRSVTSNSSGVVPLKLIACTMFATNSVVTTTYYGNYNISAVFTYAAVPYLSGYSKPSLSSYTTPLTVSNPVITMPIPGALPDLDPPVIVDPNPSYSGGTSVVTTWINNSGVVAAHDVLVYFYDSTDMVAQISEVFYQTTIALIPAGGSVQLNVNWSAPLAPGDDRYIGIEIDPLNTTSEMDEGNNLNWTLVPVVGLADLTFGSDGIYTNPSPPTDGIPTNVYAQILNDGDADALQFNVTFYYDVINGAHIIGTAHINALGANTLTVAQVAWNNPVRGVYKNHTIYAVIGTPGPAVPERDYSNNIGSSAIDIRSKPDLYISSVYAVFNGQQIAPGVEVPSEYEVTIHVLVHNSGETPVSTPVTLALYNGSKVATRMLAHLNTTVSISQGDTVDLTFALLLDPIYVPTVTLNLYALINPSVAQGGYALTNVSESIYSNNTGLLQLEVFDSRPDPMVTTDDISVFLNLTEEIRTHGNNVSYANLLTIEVTVTNDGYMPATHVSVSVNFTGMGDDIPIGVQYVDLNGSQSKIVTFTYTVAVRYSGPYHINVTLDLEQSVLNDKNRTNNVASRALNVSYIQPTITVIAPAGKGRNVTVGQLVSVIGNVKYPDGNPMKNITVTVVLKTLTGVNISGTTVTVQTTGDLGTFTANVLIPADLKGDYKLVVTVGKNSVEVLISVSPPSSILDAWMLIIIIAAIGAGVLIFSLYIYRQGVGKLVECGECGALIPESAKKCPKCGVEFEEDMVKCSECGAWIAASSVECPNCHVRFGTPLEGEKTYEGKMKDQYEEAVLSKYRELAKGDLGKKYTEESFQEWWMVNPAYISFEDWLAKEEERRTQANLITCGVCGTPNAKGSAVCHNCGSPLPVEGAAAAGATAEGAVIEKRVIRMPIDRKIVPKKVIKKPLDQEQQQGGQQQQ